MERKKPNISDIQNQDLIKIKTRGNFILRQELSDLTIECNFKTAICVNVVFFLIMGIIGIPIYQSATNSFQIEHDYTECEIQADYCNLEFTINSTITAPIYIYYQLENFFSNHKDFVKSKNFAQLRGEKVDKESLTKCGSDSLYIYQIFNNDSSRYFSFKGFPLDGFSYANPCGLISKSFFNDEYKLYNIDINSNVRINETGIADINDINYVYKKDPDYDETQWMDVENEHFMIWMRMETFPFFKKIWGRIETDLLPGKYMFKIKKVYDALNPDTKRSVVLAKTGNLGNTKFLGTIMILAGGYNLLMLIFLITLCYWNRNSTFDESKLKY